MDENFEKIIDISIFLTEETIIYPGDPQPEYKRFQELKKGDIANVGMMRHGLHHGTHVDVPYHFDDKGKKFREMPLDYWVGKVLVVDATGEAVCVNANTLKDIPVKSYQRILFKTKNSTEYYKKGVFYPQFIYLDKSACVLLAENGVKTVGLDYITVDPYGSQDFPAHNTLLSNQISIIECIDLGGVDAGEYYLMCLPLKLGETDGANARAVLLREGFRVKEG